MDNPSKNQDNYQSKTKTLQWIAIFAVFLSLISGSLLLYQWWKSKQISAKIQQKEQTFAQLEQKSSKNTKISKNNCQKCLF